MFLFIIYPSQAFLKVSFLLGCVLIKKPLWSCVAVRVLLPFERGGSLSFSLSLWLFSDGRANKKQQHRIKREREERERKKNTNATSHKGRKKMVKDARCAHPQTTRDGRDGHLRNFPWVDTHTHTHTHKKIDTEGHMSTPFREYRDICGAVSLLGALMTTPNPALSLSYRCCVCVASHFIIQVAPLLYFLFLLLLLLSSIFSFAFFFLYGFISLKKKLFLNFCRASWNIK